MTTIGILIPLCSRKQKWVNVLDIDFFNNFLPYFYSTISNKYNYRFYFAIDENDKFLNEIGEEYKTQYKTTLDIIDKINARMSEKCIEKLY